MITAGMARQKKLAIFFRIWKKEENKLSSTSSTVPRPPDLLPSIEKNCWQPPKTAPGKIPALGWLHRKGADFREGWAQASRDCYQREM